ncbi:MAG: DUF4347 domain-containing protein [Cyanobacteria bacterium P01_C01_bin.89]
MADLLTTSGTDKTHSSATLQSIALPAAPTAIALIDARIPHLDSLVANINADIHPIVLKGTDDFRAITKIISRYGNLKALHLIAYGRPGQLYLGSNWITAQTLHNNADQVRQWAKSLSQGADLLIYGCHSGAYAQGQSFLETWRSLLASKSINVAAASHAIGSPTVGALWSLDRILGAIRSALAWDAKTIDAYPAHFGFPNQFYGITGLNTGNQNDLVTVDLGTGSVVRVDGAGDLPIPGVANELRSSAIGRRPETNSVYYLNNRNPGRAPLTSAQIGFFDNGVTPQLGSGEALVGSPSRFEFTSNSKNITDGAEPPGGGRVTAGRAAFDQFSNLVFGRGNELQFINVSATGEQLGLAALGYIGINNVVNSSNRFPGVTDVNFNNGNTVTPSIDYDPSTPGNNAIAFHEGAGSGDLAFDPADGSLYLALRTDPGTATTPITVTDNTITSIEQVGRNTTTTEGGFRTGALNQRGDGREISELYRIGRPNSDGTIDFSPIVSSTLTQDGTVEVINLQAQLIGTVSAEIAGLAFGYDGELYASDAVNNELLQLDRATGQIVRRVTTRLSADDPISPNQAVNIGDLATLPLPSPVIDIDLTKSDGVTQVTPGSTVSYTVTVAHNGGDNEIKPPFPLLINDAPPASSNITIRSWSATTTGNAAVNQTTGTGNLENIEVQRLAAGETVTFTIIADISNSPTGTVAINEVVATLPLGVLDPDLSPLERDIRAIDADEIIVPPANRPPETSSASGTFVPNAATTVPLASLVTDPDSDPITTYTITELPTQGTLFITINGVQTPVTANTPIPASAINTLVYQSPNPNPASFKFTATDSQGNVSPTAGTYNLSSSIPPGNNPPQTQNASFSVIPGTSIDLTQPGGVNQPARFNIPLNGGGLLPTGQDVDGSISGGTDAYTINTLPVGGQLFIGDPNLGTSTPVAAAGFNLSAADFGNLFFRADSSFTGPTTFEFSISDGTNSSQTPGIVTLNNVATASPQINLNVDKTDNVAQVTPGALVQYNVTLNNQGGANVTAATPLLVTDVPDGNLTILGWEAFDQNGNRITSTNVLSPVNDIPGPGNFVFTLNGVQVRQLNVGDSITFRVSARVDNDVTVGGSVTNTAEVTIPPALSPTGNPQVVTATDTNQVVASTPTTNQPPLTENINETFTPGVAQPVDLPGAVTDPDSDPIASYTITKLPAGADLFLLVGGVETPVTPGTVIPAAQVGNLRFRSPTNATTSFMFAATDNQGNTSPVEGTVTFSTTLGTAAPSTQNASFFTTPNSILDLTEPPQGGATNTPAFFSLPVVGSGNLPTGSDPNGNIISNGADAYRIETLPTGGQLFVGNPSLGGTAVTTADFDLSATDFGNLFFQANVGFSGTQFQFSIFDGANRSPSQGIVTIGNVGTVTPGTGGVFPPPGTPTPGGGGTPQGPGAPPTTLTVSTPGGTVIPDGTPLTFGFPGQAPTTGDQGNGDVLTGAGLRNGGSRTSGQGSLLSNNGLLQCIVGSDPITQVFRVNNTGANNLVIDAITVPSGFAVVGDFAGRVVPPGQVLELPIQFTPTVGGTFAGNVVIQTNRAGDPFYNFPIAAKVTAPIPVTDRFPGLEVDRPEDCPPEPSPEPFGFSMKVPTNLREQPDLSLRDAPQFADTRFGGLSAGEIVSLLESTRFSGLLGNDLVIGSPGIDELLGNDGDDSLFGSLLSALQDSSPDRLGGGRGNDLLNGNGGDDVIFAGADDDTVNGGQGNDQLLGDRGNDRILGDLGDDLIFGGLGRQIAELIGDLSDEDRDELFGNAGNDFLQGSDGNDLVFGGQGDDFVRGGQGDDFALGDRGNDVVLGDRDNDLLYGGTGNFAISDPDGQDTVFGGSGNDILNGNEANDVLNGETGDDIVSGGRGDDIVAGGAGRDLIFGDLGDDSILGGLGAEAPVPAGQDGDRIFGNRGNDRINAGEGDDVVYAGKDNDIVSAGKNNDIVFGDQGQDTLNGDLGEDTLVGGNFDSFNQESAEDGADLMFGGGGNDLLLGNLGADTLVGNTGNDSIRGGRQEDILFGGAGNDLLRGDREGDTLCGDEGDDTLFGSAAGVSEAVSAADGRDVLSGGLGNDVLFGNRSEDLLNGGEGDDTLLGGRGEDTLFGSQGNDVLFGDRGVDTLIGGSGNDTFVIQDNGSVDLIIDFTPATDQLAFEGGLTLDDVSFVNVGGERVEVRNPAGVAIAILDGTPFSALSIDDVREETLNPPAPTPPAGVTPVPIDPLPTPPGTADPSPTTPESPTGGAPGALGETPAIPGITETPGL